MTANASTQSESDNQPEAQPQSAAGTGASAHADNPLADVLAAERVVAEAALEDIRAAEIAAERAAAEAEQSVPRRAINKAREIRAKLPKSLKLKIKIGISLVMFGSLPLVLKVDPEKTISALLNANPWIMAATTIIFLSTMFLTGRRWQILARAVGFQKSFLELVKLCYVGLFFNLFLPSTVGGDTVRCYYLSKGTGKYADAFYSVIADRASGIAVLFATATLGILLGPGARELPWQLKWPIYLGTFGVFVVMPFVPWLTRNFLGERYDIENPSFFRRTSNWITRQFNSSGATVFWKDKRLVFSALLWSFVTQFFMVVCHIGVGFALGLGDQIPLWYYFVFYPCVAVLGFVTPSFNGIGIREWAYSYFLMLMGVDRSHALTYALMWLGLTTFMSLVGGLVYVGSKLKPPPQEE
jgi:glycosyltransferase 2 family protein